jgi:hypothetical protein
MKLFAYPLNIENTIPIPYPLLPMPSFYEIDLHVALYGIRYHTMVRYI